MQTETTNVAHVP